ncbi:MAG: hypothetical protein A2086_12355 [Spirochaetes bacterium GWD1_27_9]|nr:MAG: hypothetical protein A2Z98_11320 [Spirochaetes bacterium GWB1_27_13]OHD23885.1 MAG: hypothetical protein A2Y34_06565 [Spirochaetes bacterium GWC1_27_15]OHD35608.1 MAG: hypothetical protein A2086_12355 [Spirochaetes bacterium GWD1_27_9]
MKNYIFLIFVSLALFSCSIPQDGAKGNVVVETPALTSSIMRSITGVDNVTLDKNNFRFNIVVENNGKRLEFLQLKQNEEKLISVPSGIGLNFYVGIYYANKDSFDDVYNVYLSTTNQKNIVVQSGETKEVVLDLNLKQKTKASSYYNTLFGKGNVSGGYIATDSFCFTYSPYENTNSKFIDYSTDFLELNAGFTVTGKGIVAKVKDPDGLNYWHIQPDGIRRSSSGNSNFSVLNLSDLKNYSEKLGKINNIGSFFVDIFGGRYYYFLNYGDGYLALNYNSLANPNTWSGIGEISLDIFSSIYPNEPFLLDVKQDELNPLWIFFATKIGLYYVSDSTLSKFATSDKEKAINEFKKLIRLKNPDNPKESILIRAIKIVDNKIYLGSRDGVFSIDRNTSEWNKFITDPTSDISIFPYDKIKKEGDLDNEPVLNVGYDDTSKGKVLIMYSSKKVIFKNLTNGKTDILSVWDGLPFISEKYKDNVNLIDYSLYDLAPINFVLWDSKNSRYWIGTKFGLASVNINDLDI